MNGLVDAFVFGYVVVALLWHLPGWSLWRYLLRPVIPLVRFLGFEQYWGMFAPEPATSNRDLVVVLELPGGGALAWEPPRLHRLSLLGAFLGFRYRAHEHSMLYDDDEGAAACRDALAEYLLRVYEGEGSPHAAVFTHVDRPLPAPGDEADDGVPARKVFYRYPPRKEA